MPILDLPLIAQWGFEANYRRTDCGCACVAMMLEYYHKRGKVTVDSLARETTLMNADVGLTPYQLVVLAGRHGMMLDVHPDTTADDLKAEIDSKRPVIALIAYRFIPNRLDQGDKVPGRDGHFVTVVGYDDTHFVLNDPDYWAPYTEKGHNALVYETDLMNAINGMGYNGQCVFSKEPMATQTEIDQLKAAIQIAQNASNTLFVSLMNTVNAMQVTSPTSTLPPSTATTRTVYPIQSDGVYVRSSPSGTKVGAFKQSTPIVVKYPASNGWYQIAEGTFAGSYITADTQYVRDAG